MSKVTIKTLREKIGTQEQVATLLGIDKTTVSKWEIGTSKPKTKDLPKIAKLFGVSISELIDSLEFKKEKANGNDKRAN